MFLFITFDPLNVFSHMSAFWKLEEFLFYICENEKSLKNGLDPPSGLKVVAHTNHVHNNKSTKHNENKKKQLFSEI